MVCRMESNGDRREERSRTPPETYNTPSRSCKSQDDVEISVKITNIPQSCVALPPVDVTSNTERAKASVASGSGNSDQSTAGMTKQRPRIYPGYQYQASGSSQWSPAGYIPTKFLQSRRIAQTFHHQPYPHPATLNSSHRKLKPTGTMEYVPSPESFYSPDMAKSTFDASPNSLYMYDQERYDMQNTLAAGMFGQTGRVADMTTLGSEPDFDLNPQYENSNSLEGFFGGALNSSGALMPDSQDSLTSSPRGGPDKPMSGGMLGLLGVGPQDLKLQGPTLAQLNMDPYLMEDIDTIINANDLHLHKTQLSRPSAVGAKHTLSSSDLTKPSVSVLPAVKTETGETLTPLKGFSLSQMCTDLTRGAQSSTVTSLFGNRTNVAVVPPISSVPTTPASSTPIKSEPMDTYESGSQSCLHKMLSSPSSQKVLSPLQTCGSPPGRQVKVMSVVGQTRAPPLGQQVKTESVEEKWKEIEKFIHDPETSSSRKRTRHASGSSSVMSDDEDARPASHPYASYNSDDDSDSDADSDISDTPLDESLTELAKKSKQYFWQYNVQAKGPKGTRLKLRINDQDPHHPSNFEDPVFDANSTSLVGIRHGGKARKGDGNEVSANPRKLFQIGKQLYKLNRQINGFQVSSDVPASVRNKSRKEKNKLASRACRLKKKAQHEANKVKLTGLDCEQGELLGIIGMMWPQLRERARQRMKGVMPSPSSVETLSDTLEALVAEKHKTAIAGNTTDYVNEAVAKVEGGDPTGGLAIKLKVRK